MSQAVKCLILLAVVALLFVTELIPLAITATAGGRTIFITACCYCFTFHYRTDPACRHIDRRRRCLRPVRLHPC